MRKVLAAVIGWAMLAGCAQGAERLAQVAQGRLAGEVAEGVASFKGVPFAAPPVGPLRWREPQGPATWSGVRPAKAFAASCMQPTLSHIGPWTQEYFARPPFSEDCLYLNVWAPAAAKGAPVMVWFHGGGLNQGGTSLPLYDGTALAKRGVVVVSVNYRVGPFGFLAHPELTAESPHHSSGDYGFLDQRAALQWVKANVAAFGGDPRKVTIFGQSAGARSVTVHMVSPLSRGLFQRAIAQSGVQYEAAGGMMRAASLAEAEQRGVAFAGRAGAKSLAELRATSADAIQAAPDFREGVVVDGWLLPKSPGELIAAGGLADVPFLTGFNRQEGSGDLDAPADPAGYEAEVRKAYGARADAVLALYPGGAQAQASRIAAGHDRTMVLSQLWLAARARSASTPAFLYDYEHVLPGATAGKYGAFHSAELGYVFGTLGALDRPFAPADSRVADLMQRYWVNFATQGDPNGPGLPAWPRFDPSAPQVMALGEQPHVRPITSPEKLKCWRRRWARPRRRAASAPGARRP